MARRPPRPGGVPAPRPAVATRRLRTSHPASRPASRERCTPRSTCQSRASSRHRGFAGATTIHNFFDLDPAARRPRRRTRAVSGSPTTTSCCCNRHARSSARTCPARARFAARTSRRCPTVGRHLWISGPAEDGYGRRLDASSTADRRARDDRPRRDAPPTRTRRATSSSFPSTWEGFGNPVIESIAARRRVRRFRIRCSPRSSRPACGCFSTDDPTVLVRFLADPDPPRDLLRREPAARPHLVLARRPPGRDRRRRSPRTAGPSGERRSGPRPARADRTPRGVWASASATRRSASRSSLFVVRRDHRLRGGRSTVIATGLVAACVILPIPIVLGYGVRAAEPTTGRPASRPGR